MSETEKIDKPLGGSLWGICLVGQIDLPCACFFLWFSWLLCCTLFHQLFSHSLDARIFHASILASGGEDENRRLFHVLHTKYLAARGWPVTAAMC